MEHLLRFLRAEHIEWEEEQLELQKKLFREDLTQTISRFEVMLSELGTEIPVEHRELGSLVAIRANYLGTVHRIDEFTDLHPDPIEHHIALLRDDKYLEGTEKAYRLIYDVNAPDEENSPYDFSAEFLLTESGALYAGINGRSAMIEYTQTHIELLEPPRKQGYEIYDVCPMNNYDKYTYMDASLDFISIGQLLDKMNSTNQMDIYVLE